MFSLKKLVLFVIPAALFLTSCKDEEAPKPNPNPGNQPVNNLPALELTDVLTDTVLQDRNSDPAKIDYLVNSNIRVKAKLTIAAGVVIGFAQDARLDINTDGSILTQGTAEKKVRFIGQTAQSGFWSGIIIYSPASLNAFAHTEILHAGSKAMLDNLKTAIALFDNARVSITNTTVSQSGGYGIFLREKSVLGTFANNTLSHNTEAPLLLTVHNIPQLDAATSFSNSNGRNIIEVQASTISGTSEVVWPVFADNTPYRFLGRIRTQTGWKLLPGTIIEVAEDNFIDVDNGYLNAVGTAAKKITITGEVKSAGSWNGIAIYTRSANNVMEHVQVQYSGGKALFGGTKASIALFGGNSASLNIRNSEISSSGGFGIHVFGNKATLNSDVETANTFTNNALTKVYYEN